jgi:uncharacterized membrane protein
MLNPNPTPSHRSAYTTLTTRRVVRIAIIAALYAVITLAIAPIGIAYTPIQLRVSEALKVFVLFDPALAFGIGIGTFIGNLGSPYGIWDLTWSPLTDIAGGLLAWAVYRYVLRGRMPAVAMALYALTTSLAVTIMFVILGVDSFLVLLPPILLSELVIMLPATPLMFWIKTQLEARGIQLEPHG